MESELFGHEKGAFTGATARRVGRFELAGGGTLLLDEIGDLEPSLQTKLLRVLQDGKFERVGGHETLDFRARVVAATHKPVHPGEPGSQLREDLYYRLAVVEIHVPPLRARRSDIPQLVAHALRAMPARAVSEAAMERLSAYHWPGNVRELMHVVERAGALCSGEVIDVAGLARSRAQPCCRAGRVRQRQREADAARSGGAARAPDDQSRRCSRPTATAPKPLGGSASRARSCTRRLKSTDLSSSVALGARGAQSLFLSAQLGG
ncbi:MAG: sigma 54-interacting transcriptional regulator [Polyangiaceae bacterium]